MLLKNREQPFEIRGRIEPEPGFDCESYIRAVSAQGTQNCINTLGFAEKPATGAFAINDGGRAAEVQIDAGDFVSLKFGCGSDERGDIIADHLSNDGLAGRVFGDRT